MKTVQQRPLTWSHRVIAALGSSWLFRVLVGFFVLQAAWLALSGRYPMAFDEDFHVGIIRLYAHHLSPFWSSQPENADRFGAVARDPSYLYHYLMSFPYRLIAVFTSDQTIQVLWLRAINIALFASGLVLFRRLFRRTGAHDGLLNCCFAVFCLLPVMPLLAAQINYDNLLFPLTALSLLLTIRFARILRLQRRLDVRTLFALISLCLLTSLVKYAFLPIFLAISIYVIVYVRRQLSSWRAVVEAIRKDFKLLSRPVRWLLPLLFLLCIGLFLQRDGYNIVRYHTPVPDCSKVLSVEACSEYGPWIRDYNLSTNKTNASRSPVVFTADWFYGMWLRLFFAVDGPASDFDTKGPLLVPAVIGMVYPVLAVTTSIIYGRRLLRRDDANALWLLGFVSCVYVVTLWLDQYRAFLRTGQPVAINGRYLLPVLLPLLLLGALGCRQWLRRPSRRLLFTGIALLGLFWGGGTLTYILRSNDTWYWPSQPVRQANHAVKQVLGPVTPGYKTPTLFLR